MLKKMKETFQEASAILEEEKVAKKPSKLKASKEKLITGFDKVNKKEAFLRENQEIHSGFEIFWLFMEKLIISTLLIASGLLVFKNYFEKLSTLKNLIKAIPGIIVILYQVALIILPIIWVYKKVAKLTFFKVQQTVNTFLDITVRSYDPQNFDEKEEWKSFIISKALSKMVKHETWKEFMGGGVKYYRQRKFSDSKLLPIMETAFSKNHKNSFTKENNNED